MTFTNHHILRTGILTAILTVFALSACKLTQDEKDAIDDATEDPPVSDEPNTDHPETGQFCYEQVHHQPDAVITKKIDLLFVVDTSGSLTEEREAIGNGVDTFVQELPSDVDPQFGVMLAHAESRSGELYRDSSSLPYVLREEDFSSSQLRTVLRERMRDAPNEWQTDGGEVGLYSMNEALTDSKISQAKDQGFFRDNAALAVVFVADENDICARYPDGVTRVHDPNGKEGPAFDQYCKDVDAESVYKELKEFQGNLPLAVAGVIYHEGSDFPHSGENEIGYGYKKLVELANGVKVDLSGDHLHEGLSEIGNLATKTLNLVTEFPIKRETFDESSLVVEVDGEKVPFEYVKDANEIHLTDYAGVENSEVYVSYCTEEKDGSGGGDSGDGSDDDGDSSGGGEVIAQISSFEIDSVQQTSATFTWTTDVAATSQVEVENALTGKTFYSDLNNNETTEHSVTVEGLESNTLYTVRALSETQAGIATSDRVDFRTAR